MKPRRHGFDVKRRIAHSLQIGKTHHVLLPCPTSMACACDQCGSLNHMMYRRIALYYNHAFL
jgi:hypothetical protein